MIRIFEETNQLLLANLDKRQVSNITQSTEGLLLSTENISKNKNVIFVQNMRETKQSLLNFDL